ncbi:ROK family transcriptional regulator [Deinococcus roseus]|uniref:Sugar kinase n=1 Tax=Deinococcus roseus TaxID=392414 RepID=A0ABQ2DG49_9DEIO|nr:ROK family transcriptional regulator [Deinococcus roseus]GGJ56063.1 sugar kinase [Deinococcus roseus]
MKQPQPKGDQSYLRAHNRSRVLNHLRTHGATTRTQLAQSTGLSNTAISILTGELLDEGLILETSIGQASQQGGRKPIFLDIHYQAHLLIGLKVIPERIDAVLTDFATTVLTHHTEPLTDHNPEHVAHSIERIARHFIVTQGLNPTQIKGIGVALPGIIDTHQGLAIHTPSLTGHHIPLAQMVQRLTGLPTVIDNDINTFAVAERLYGHGKNSQNFLVIGNGNGLGAALVLDGQIHTGKNGGAGEFGHNTAVLHGRTCSCGRKGCLEAYVSEPALLQQYHELHPTKTESVTSIENLIDLAQHPHTPAHRLFTRAGHLLGLHLSYLVNTYSPELIVFGGEAVRLGDPFFHPMQQALQTHSFTPYGQDTPLILVPWNTQDFTHWGRGAASLAAQHAFAQPRA